MKNKIVAVLAAFGFALAALVGVPAATGTDAAQAGNCSAPGLCGKVINASSYQIGLIQNYGQPITRYILPGGNSTNYFPDTDQVYLPRKMRLCLGPQTDSCWSAGPGTIKITDNFKSYYVRN